MRTADSFLKGYKPAFLEIPDREWTTKHLDFLLTHYPYVDEKRYDILEGDQYYLFFQDELIQALFQKQMQQISTKEDLDRVLGNILGFPPKAVDFYARMMKEKRNGNENAYQQMKKRKIGMIYCGCSFASDVRDLKVNVKWLLEKYPYEEAKEEGIFVRVDGERLKVPFKHEDEFTEFYEYILSKYDLVLHKS